MTTKTPNPFNTVIVPPPFSAAEKLRFEDAFSLVQEAVFMNSSAHGFHDEGFDEKGVPRKNFSEQIALMHSELSEALEAHRKGIDRSEHIPDFTAVEEEIADLVIRAMDFAELRGLKLAEAIMAKHEFNKNRPFRHNKKF
jgi:NTP pyrophosphatase (non-canonical NTP hydrolase)